MTNRCGICSTSTAEPLYFPCLCRTGVHAHCVPKVLDRCVSLPNGQWQCACCSGTIYGRNVIVGVRWSRIPLLLAMPFTLAVSAYLCTGLLIPSESDLYWAGPGFPPYAKKLASLIRLCQTAFLFEHFWTTTQTFCIEFHRNGRLSEVFYSNWLVCVLIQLLLESAMLLPCYMESISFSMAPIAPENFAVFIVILSCLLHTITSHEFNKSGRCHRHGFLDIEVWVVRRWQLQNK